MHKRLLILGTRGVPAQYGDFERLAEELALHLVQKGWRVTVYCQEDWSRTVPYETMWGRVRRVHIPVKQKGFLGNIMFGLKSSLHARNQASMALTLGYHSAIFSLFQRLRGKTNTFHIGDQPHKSAHWGPMARLWLALNHRAARLFGSHFIVDNAETLHHFKSNVSKDNISLIPTGALAVTDSSTKPLRDLNLESGKFSTFIALATPDHSLMEVVQAFSQEPRNHKLVVLGEFDENNPYHQRVLASASDEVQFVGPIHDQTIVRALRYHSQLYFHGHQNGGTSPSLVESLAAGCPIIAFDSPANRWVAGPEAAAYFKDTNSCAAQISALLHNPTACLEMKKAARLRHAEAFTLDVMLSEYEDLLSDLNPYQADNDQDS